MRLRLVAGVVFIFVVATVILTTLLFGSGLLTSAALSRINTASAPDISSQATATAQNIIVNENTHPGTSSWKTPIDKEATTQIQAYASATSVAPGQRLSFYVSTQQDNTPYWIDIYRLGWYQGYGGRLMASTSSQIGHAQGYYDSANHRLVNCNSCFIDKTTGLVEARWQPSYALTVPSDWVTGVYLAKFTTTTGLQTYAPFDVLGNSSSRYIAVTPDTTYQAYNDWGAASLYDPANGITGETDTPARAVKVSFERPYTQGNGSSQVLVFEANAIHWLERQGYDLSYMSNVDLHVHPKVLLQHHAYLSLGHDEYWTKEMRDAVENARDFGVGLAFLGANASYWQMRFEPDSTGTLPDKTIVCYKVLTSLQNLQLDPIFGKDNTRLTTQWRDPALARPENTLIGVMYSSLTHRQSGYPWRVSLNTNSTLLKDSGLKQNQQYGCGLVGYEWDRIFTNGATPAGLQVIGESTTIDDSNKSDFSDTTYYISASGAMVFATGSIYWTAALDNYRFNQDRLCNGQTLVVPGMQQLMANVMNAIAITHFSQQLTF
jgi:N,N-dimethylformamidase beta subunit-like protein